jgi:hypothetical protein
MFVSLLSKITVYCEIFCEPSIYPLYVLLSSLLGTGRPGLDGCLARFVYNFLNVRSS